RPRRRAGRAPSRAGSRGAGAGRRRRTGRSCRSRGRCYSGAATGYRSGVRDPAPPYRGEGPPALWHVSEDARLEAFEPRRGGDSPGLALVWAVDTRHLPLYWFPRDCPRATFWAAPHTSETDVGRLLGGDRTRRVHAIEEAWLGSMRETRVVAY